MRLGKKIAAVFFAAALLFCVLSPALFSEAAVSCDVRRGALPEGITVTEELSRGAKQLRYQNIDRYVEKMRAQGIPDEEIARAILSAMEGESVSAALPAEYLAEGLTEGEVVQTISYLKIARDGSYEYLTEEEMTAALKRESGFFAKLFSRGDSYYRMTVTAAEISAPENYADDYNRSVLSAGIVTLKNSAFRDVDTAILGITWDGAVFDDSYSELALAVRQSGRGETVDIRRHIDGIKAGNTDKAVERLTIEYDWGVRCEARAGRMFLLWGDSVTEQYVRTRVYLQKDTYEAAAYYTWEYPLIIADADGVRLDIPSYDVPMYWTPSMRIAHRK